MNNLLLLWKEVLRSPRSLGTIAPSSKWLAMDLIEAANLRKDTVTVEIGAGTGPLTEWIINTVEPVHFIALEPKTTSVEGMAVPIARSRSWLAFPLPAYNRRPLRSEAGCDG